MSAFDHCIKKEYFVSLTSVHSQFTTNSTKVQNPRHNSYSSAVHIIEHTGATSEERRCRLWVHCASYCPVHFQASKCTAQGVSGECTQYGPRQWKEREHTQQDEALARMKISTCA